MRRVMKNTLFLLPAAFLAACASPFSPEQACSTRTACEAKPSGDYVNPLADYVNPLTDYVNPWTRGDTTNNGGNGGSN